MYKTTRGGEPFRAFWTDGTQFSTEPREGDALSAPGVGRAEDVSIIYASSYCHVASPQAAVRKKINLSSRNLKPKNMEESSYIRIYLADIIGINGLPHSLDRPMNYHPCGSFLTSQAIALCGVRTRDGLWSRGEEGRLQPLRSSCNASFRRQRPGPRANGPSFPRLRRITLLQEDGPAMRKLAAQSCVGGPRRSSRATKKLPVPHLDNF